PPRLNAGGVCPRHDLGGPGGYDDDVVHRRVPRNLGRAGGAARAARSPVPDVAAAGLGEGAAGVVGVADDDAALEARSEFPVLEPVDVGGREPEVTRRAARGQIAVK